MGAAPRGGLRSPSRDVRAESAEFDRYLSIGSNVRSQRPLASGRQNGMLHSVARASGLVHLRKRRIGHHALGRKRNERRAPDSGAPFRVLAYESKTRFDIVPAQHHVERQTKERLRLSFGHHPPTHGREVDPNEIHKPQGTLANPGSQRGVISPAV